ncbi:MAG: NAD-dependent epimerase/dehydratase family protein, partial [Verrucomicrobia bacterium]|nr:NAD-dependent epimerase/dehydratase family protein [Verrucomicrobiota bacterium]
MKILITGVSGLIGSATQTYFQRRGHQVVGLTRDSTAADNTRLFHWDPLSGNLDPKALSGVDGV